jgi:type II secretory pathway component PulK
MKRKGQTLITLLVFMIVALTVAATSVSIIITNAQKSTASIRSMEAYYAAEAGIENASLSLLRDPTYAGETLQVTTEATAVISVTYDGQYTVLSKGTVGDFTRTIMAKFDYTNSVLSVVSWQEIYQ